jgi:hypothetical protein
MACSFACKLPEKMLPIFLLALVSMFPSAFAAFGITTSTPTYVVDGLETDAVHTCAIDDWGTSIR